MAHPDRDWSAVPPAGSTSRTTSLLGLAGALLLAACGQANRPVPDDDDPLGEPLLGDGATDFISYVPGDSGYASGDGGLSAGSAESGTGGTAGTDDSAGTNEAERAITEADIIQLDGDRLFALSQYSGLSVVDVSNPARLSLVGNLRFRATPFEMYLDGTTAYVMFNDYGYYDVDEENGAWVWVSSSRMQAIDVSNPAAPRVVGESVVPGRVADSRKVGDVIYLVTHQSPYCWGCDASSSTRVTSFDASSQTEFRQIDQVIIESADESWTRSVSVTTERAYVSGWGWDPSGNGSGTIDVIDISDAAGDLVKGASISIAGQIQSRWQMEEEGGVLRVISQPGGWGTTNPPVLETFAVNSASDIDALGSLTMVLPRPEQLMSVRFAGERAYAVTFEQTDPLFTFDLSNPAAPVQVGELEIPGWVYHMEPRGDRIYALGYDPGVDGGALHVSLFDVSTLSNPIMLDRVNFGGDWASFAEDQDRIHKAFSILEDEGLILVPYSGTNYDDGDCDYSWHSGIQLVDMTTDSLTLRGVAPQLGSARRSFLSAGTLFGVSDHAVQTFDITDRDAPKDIDQLETARNITTVKKVGDQLVRFGNDWWTERTILDVTSPGLAHLAEPLGELELSAVIGNESSCSDYPSGVQVYRSGYWGGQVFVHGTHAYVPRYEHVSWYSPNDPDRTYGSHERLAFYVVDLTAEGGPEIERRFEVAPMRSEGYFAGIVQTDSALLVGRSEGYFSYDSRTGQKSEPTFSYDVIDLADAATADVVANLEVPSLWAGGGWGYGMYGCSIDMGWGWWGYGGYYGYGGDQNALVSGDIVASQHLEPLDDEDGRVRYYLDRIDVSDPRSPKLLEPVNIPGNVVGYDDADQSLVTIDYVMEKWDASSWEDCRRDGQYGYFDSEDGKCRLYQRRVNSLELVDDLAWRKGMKLIDDGFVASGIAVTDSRVFYLEVDSGGGSSDEPRLTSLAIDGAGYLSQLPATTISTPGGYFWGNVTGRGDRAFVTSEGSIHAVDTRGGEPSVQEIETPGWSCQSLEVAGKEAYCAQGEYGVTAFTLE